MVSAEAASSQVIHFESESLSPLETAMMDGLLAISAEMLNQNHEAKPLHNPDLLKE